MINNISDSKQVGGEGSNRFKKRVIPLLSLLLVIVITVGILYFYRNYPDRIEELKDYGYWGAFLASLIGNATIILPGAVLVILSNIGVLLYSAIGPIGPIIVGLAGGAGAAIGEITGYVAGYSGRAIVGRKGMYSRVEGLVVKWGAIAIFLFSLLPLMFDLAGIAAGVIRFPFWKFFLLCWLGRTILYVVFILLAALGWQALLPYLS